MFPNIEPYASGMLDVGDSQQIYWECSGNPAGRPVVYLHGGPGSGSPPQCRRYFDPAIYKIVLTDQRGCGRSRPHVQTIDDLEVNTIVHLIEDLESLRKHLRIDRWTLLGASWGSTLAQAYAQTFPSHVAAIVLACVTTTSRREVQWITRDMGRIFAEEWERFASIASHSASHAKDLVDIYAELVFSADSATREFAAREWCAWEHTHVSLLRPNRVNPRFEDPEFRLLFTRLVTHYWRHAGFLGEGQLIRNAGLLNDIPGVLLHGRYDISSPLETAWRLHKAWRNSALHIIEDAGHGGEAFSKSIVEAMNRVALTERSANRTFR